MMIFCKWRKNHDSEGKNSGDGELECDGTYRSYKVDDISLNGEDLDLEERGFRPDDNCEKQSLIGVNIKNKTSTSSGKGFPVNERRKTSLILTTANLDSNSERSELFNFQVPSSKAKKDEEKRPFLSHLINFFSNVICGSRSILTLDTDVTISTIKKLSCETLEGDMSNLACLVTGCNDEEAINRDKNKSLANLNPRKTTEASSHQHHVLRKGRSLPNIKLKDFETNRSFNKESDILIVYPRAQSMEEQVMESKTSTLCSKRFPKSLEANDYFVKDEDDVSDFTQSEISHMRRKEFVKYVSPRNKDLENLCFSIRIAKNFPYFCQETKNYIKELLKENDENMFLVLKRSNASCSMVKTLTLHPTITDSDSSEI